MKKFYKVTIVACVALGLSLVACKSTTIQVAEESTSTPTINTSDKTKLQNYSDTPSTNEDENKIESLTHETYKSDLSMVKISTAGKTFKIGIGNVKFVKLTYNFYISNHEVTQKEWTDVMGSNPSYFQNNPRTGEDQNLRPVESISWYEAIAYCNKKTETDGIKIGDTKNFDYVYFTDKACTTAYTITDARSNTTPYMKIKATGYRLPTEAEWEIAARGGLIGYIYAGTANASELGTYAWYGESLSDGHHEVKKKQPNAYGLYDMSGNVWEWCWDTYVSNTYTGEVTDSVGAISGSQCVTRGGSWSYRASFCSMSSRFYYWPEYRDNNLGFRIARSAGE